MSTNFETIGRQLRNVLRSRRGNVSVIAALTIMPVAAIGGSGIDFARMSSVRAKAQAALDAGALAAGATGTVDLTPATVTFNKNFTVPDATVSNLAYTQSGDYINGKVTVSVPTSFLGIVGVTSLDVGIATQAKVATKRITTATFTITSAQGAYDKEIYIWTKDAAGTITSTQKVLTYDYNLSNGTGTKTYTPALNQTYTVNVPAYSTYGLQMVAYEDTTYTGKRVNPKNFYSDAANSSTFIKRTGDCGTAGGETSSWEDGGDSNFKDLVSVWTCTLSTGNEPLVRLSK